jgi:hypothetical protein
MATYKVATKETIIGNLDTAFRAISGIAYVDWQRGYDQGITKNRHPGCFINDIRIDKEKLLSDITKNLWTVGIIGFVWAGPDENLGTVQNTFTELVKDAIIAARTRGGNAYTTNIEVLETDWGNRHPQGMFSMMLQIIFFSPE